MNTVKNDDVVVVIVSKKRSYAFRASDLATNGTNVLTKEGVFNWAATKCSVTPIKDIIYSPVFDDGNSVVITTPIPT